VILWIDAQLSPALAGWIEARFGLRASSLRDLSLRDASDQEIFHSARLRNAVLVSKDQDLKDLVELHGPPPQLIWIRCGNTSKEALKRILETELPQALARLRAGEPVIRIG